MKNTGAGIGDNNGRDSLALAESLWNLGMRSTNIANKVNVG